MKTLTLLLSALVLAVVAAAQGPTVVVEVVNFDWKYDGYVSVETVKNSKSATSTRVKRGTDYVFKYKARATVKNAGAKAVRAIEWDYVFDEPGGGKELKRYKLRSKQKATPGATLLLSDDIFIKPEESTSHINAGRQKVVITRVEYADGSAWRPDEKKL